MISVIFGIVLLTALSVDCTSPMFKVNVVRKYGSRSNEETLKIFLGNSATGTPVFEILTGQQDAATQNFEFCASTFVYTLQLRDSYGDGWSLNSDVRLLRGDELLGEYTFPSVSGARDKKEKLFLMEWISFIEYGEAWKVTNIAQTTNTWRTSVVDWNETASFPQVTTVTRYFRKSYTDESAMAFGIFANVKTTSGFVMYINGNKLFSWNMPTGIINANTLATVAETEVKTYSYSNTLAIIDVPKTVHTYEIAVEVHAATLTPSGVEAFDANIKFLVGDNSRRIDNTGTPAGSHAGFNGEGFANLYDDSIQSKWCFRRDEGEIAWTTWTFSNGRRELINKYAITSGQDSPERDIAHWKVFASNDGVNWVMLDERSGVIWPFERSQRKTFSMINQTPFNVYKLEVHEHLVFDSITQFSEWSLIMSDVPKFVEVLEYADTAFIAAKDVDSVNIAPKLGALFSQWSINPAMSLPAGLTFDTNNGVITGMATSILSLTTFTISAVKTSNGEAISTTFSLTIFECKLPAYVIVKFEKTMSTLTTDTFSVKNAAGVIVYQHNPNLAASANYNLCIASGVYTVNLMSSTGGVWNKESALSISATVSGSTYKLVQTRLTVAVESSFLLNLVYPVAPAAFNSEIKYLIDGTIPTGWNTVGFTATGWTTLTEASRPTSTQKTMFYYTSFNMASTADVQAIELRFKSKAGVLAYLNGIEVYRANLPAGDITSSTAAVKGDAEASWNMVIVNGKNVVMGTNKLAIAIVNMASELHVVEFDVAARVMSDTIGLTRYYDVTVSPNDMPLFDSKTTTTFSGSTSSPLNAIITFNGRRETFNKYCFVTSTNPSSSDPRSWKITASNDAQTWTELSVVTNVSFSTRATTYCFFMASQNAAFSTYRLTLTSPGSADATMYKLNLWSLYNENLNIAVVPEFSMNPDVVVGYTDVPFPAMTSSSNYYSFFTILPALPEGLKLNDATGAVTGTLSKAVAAQPYVLSAKNHLDETKTTTVTLSVEICSNGKIAFTLVFDMKDFATTCSFELKDLVTNTVVEHRDFFSDNMMVSLPMCRDASIFSLLLKKANVAGWGESSVSVLLADKSVLLKESLASGSTSKEYPFNVKYEVPPLYTEWSYKFDGEADADWTTGDCSSWSKAMPGNFPTSTEVTQYFVRKFDVTSLDNFSTLEMSMVIRDGAIMYLNGREIRRVNLPEGPITFSTQAVKGLSATEKHTTSDLVQRGLIKLGSNVMAVELHQYVNNDGVSAFDASAILTLNNMYMMVGGTGTTVPKGGLGETSDKVFDNNSSTKVFISGTCVGSILTYSFPEARRVIITNYGLVAAGDYMRRVPSGWNMEASDNGIDWVKMDGQNAQYFTKYFEQKRYDFVNMIPYKMYRLVITECKNINLPDSDGHGDGNDMQLADFYMFSKRVTGLCGIMGDFDAVADGMTSLAQCPIMYEGTRNRTCSNGVFGEEVNHCIPLAPASINYEYKTLTLFNKKDMKPMTPRVIGIECSFTISPKLPEGLTLDNVTGTLSGKPVAEQNMKEYEITVSNRGGKKATRLTIEIISTPINWTVIIIVIIVVIIVAVVLIVVLTTTKKGKGGSPAKGKKVLKAKPVSTQKSKNKASTAALQKTVKI